MNDQELIAGLAEGTLGPEDAARAEELIAADPALQAELASQRRALEALRAAPRPGLTMAESAALHRGVRTALGLEAETPAPRRSYRWLGAAVAVAAVVLVAVVGPLIGLLSTGDDSPDLAITTIATATEEDDGAQSRLGAATTAPAVTDAAAEAPAAEAPTEALSAAEPPAFFGTGLGEITSEDLDSIASGFVFSDEGLSFRALTEQEAAGLEDLGVERQTNQAGDLDPAICQDPVMALFPETEAVVAISPAVLDGQDVIVYAVAGSQGSQIIAVELEDCQLVAASGG